MREVAVSILIDAGRPPERTQFGQVWYVELTSPANSWNPLAVTNGCRATWPAVNDVPTRIDTRPSWLSISSTAIVPANWLFRGGMPTALKGSTSVRDQMKPADGSMNQLFCSWN